MGLAGKGLSNGGLSRKKGVSTVVITSLWAIVQAASSEPCGNQVFHVWGGKNTLAFNEANKLPVIKVTSTRGKNMSTRDLGLALLNDVI